MEQVNKHIEIEIKSTGSKQSYPIGISPMEIFNSEGIEMPHSPMGLPMLALVNNTPTPLSHPLHRPAIIDYIGYESAAGRRTYTSTVALILYKTADRLGYPPVVIEHALSNGYYGVIGNRDTPPTSEILDQLSIKMREIIAQDYPIRTIYMRSEGCRLLPEQREAYHRSTYRV